MRRERFKPSQAGRPEDGTGRLNTPSKSGFRKPRPGFDLPEHRVTTSSSAGDFSQSEGEMIPNLAHGPSIGTECPYVKDGESLSESNCPHGQTVPIIQCIHMREWLNLPMFRHRLDGFCKLSGKTRDEVAKILGLSPSSFPKYIYGTGKRTLTMDHLEIAAKLFNCSIYDFVVEVGTPNDSNSLDGFSPKGRTYTQLIVEKFRSDAIEDEDLEILYGDVLRDWERIQSITARKMAKGKKKD